MKIALISPKLNKSGIDNAPIPQGILSLSAVVKNKKCECDILDYNRYDYGSEILKKYDLVGISVFTSQLPHATALADAIVKDTKIVWGGIHCLLDPISVLSRYPDTFVVSGEGENSLSKLIDYFSNKQADLDSIEGLSYSKDGKYITKQPVFLDDVNNIPDIDYYDLPYLEKYLDMDLFYFQRKMRALEVVTSRGCFWDCSFCINSIFRSHKAYHRSKTFDKIRREIEKVVDDFKIEALLPRDDDFFSNRKLVSDWSSYTREKGLLWGGNCRYNYIGNKSLGSEELSKLADTGLFEMGMSVEAGDETLRNTLLNKKIKDEDITKAVEVIKQSKTAIVVNTSFVSHFPGDTMDNRIKTIKWMDYLSKNLNIVFSGPQIYRTYPGSRLYNLENKHVLGDMNYYLSNMTAGGWLKTSVTEDEDELLFSSTMLSHFFTSRFCLIEKCGDNKVIKTNIRKIHWLTSTVLSVLMIPIKIRLKTDCWRFFIEPRYIGKMYRLFKCFYWFLKKFVPPAEVK